MTSDCTTKRQKGLAIRKRNYPDGTSSMEAIRVKVIFKTPPLSTHNISSDSFMLTNMSVDEEEPPCDT